MLEYNGNATETFSFFRLDYYHPDLPTPLGILVCVYNIYTLLGTRLVYLLMYLINRPLRLETCVCEPCVFNL